MDETAVLFNANNLMTLLKTRPFVPFRLILSNGGTVEVRSQELVLPGRQLAVIGLLDPAATDSLIDTWTTIWYTHVTRVEQLQPGAPPFSASAGPADSITPSAV